LENKRKPILFKVTEPSSIVGGDDRITVSYEFLLHASSSIVLKGVGRRVADITYIQRDRGVRVWGEKMATPLVG
jgi:hypothetical protein